VRSDGLGEDPPENPLVTTTQQRGCWYFAAQTDHRASNTPWCRKPGIQANATRQRRGHFSLEGLELAGAPLRRLAKSVKRR